MRLLLASLVTVPFALVMLALLAALYSLVLGLPVTTLVLALAPAGIAEMALTGKVLGLDAALITGFQIVRIVMAMGLAAWAVPAVRAAGGEVGRGEWRRSRKPRRELGVLPLPQRERVGVRGLLNSIDRTPSPHPSPSEVGCCRLRPPIDC